MFSIVFWGLWNLRNKMRIEGVFPRSANAVLYKCFYHLQTWRILLKPADQAILDDQMSKLKTWMEDFTPLDYFF